MPKAVVGIAFSHATDAAFRVWGKGVSDGIKSVLTTGYGAQTADTGQVDWTTAVRPATNVYTYYEIYRLDDALQTTSPVFFKVEYGTGSAATYAGMAVTAGTGTSGAGALTGTLSTRQTLPVSGSATSLTTQYLSYFCANSGYFAFAAGCGAYGGQSMFGLVVERVRDDAEALLGEGFHVIPIPNTTCGTGYAVRTDVPQFNSSGSYCLVPSGRSSFVYGTNVQVFRHYAATGSRVRNLVGSCSVSAGDVAAGTEFPVSLMGTTRTFVALSGWTSGACSGSTAGISLALRYET